MEKSRELSEDNAASIDPDLAYLLLNLASHLTDVGLRDLDEALQSNREALNMYKKLAEQNPAAYNPNLAASLHNLAAQIWV